MSRPNLQSEGQDFSTVCSMGILRRLCWKVADNILPPTLFYLSFFLPFLSPNRPSADALKHAVHVFDVVGDFWFPHHVLYAATLLPFARLAEKLGTYPFVGFRLNTLLWAELFLIVLYLLLKRLTRSVSISQILLFFISSTYMFISYAGLTEAYIPSATVLAASLLLLMIALEQLGDRYFFFFYSLAILAFSFATTLHQMAAISAIPLATFFVAISRSYGLGKVGVLQLSFRRAIVLAIVFVTVAGLISFGIHVYGYAKSQDSRPFVNWLMHYHVTGAGTWGTTRNFSLQGVHENFVGLATAFSGSAPFLQEPKETNRENWLVFASVVGVTLVLLGISFPVHRQNRSHAFVVASLLFWMISEELFMLWFCPAAYKCRIFLFLPFVLLFGLLLSVVDKGIALGIWRSVSTRTLVIVVSLCQLAVNTKNLIVPGFLQNYLDPFEPYLYMVRAVSTNDVIVAADRHMYAYRVVFNFVASHVVGGWENAITTGRQFGIDSSATAEQQFAEAWQKKIGKFRQSRDILQSRRGRLIYEQHGWLQGVVFGYGDDFPLSGPLAMAKFVSVGKSAIIADGVDDCLMNWVSDEDREECFRALGEEQIARIVAMAGKKNLGVERLSTKRELVLRQRTNTETKNTRVLVPERGVFLDAPAKLLASGPSFANDNLRRLGIRLRWTAKEKVFWIKVKPDMINRDGSGLTIDLTLYPWLAGRVIEEIFVEGDTRAGGEARIEAKVVANRPGAN